MGRAVFKYFDAEIAICNCVACMWQLYPVVTEVDEVCIKWIVILRRARMEVMKNLLSADI